MFRLSFIRNPEIYFSVERDSYKCYKSIAKCQSLVDLYPGNSPSNYSNTEVDGIGFVPAEISKNSVMDHHNISKRMEKIGRSIHLKPKPDAMYLIEYIH